MSKIHISIYNKIGRFIRNVYCPADAKNIQCEQGENWIVGIYDDSYYMVDGVPAARPQMPGSLDTNTIAADASEVATISNLPQPCTVTFKGQQYEVADGSFGFTVDIPGTFVVKVEAWPHLDDEFTVEAIEE